MDAPCAAAVRLHRQGGRPFDRARTELAYGEGLFRQRRSEARAPLRSATEGFERLGTDPWAARARAGLRAAGGDASRSARDDMVVGLTSRELQIVRLAATGVSSREIAARLVVSHRTVEFHLNRAFPKLGVTSRAELGQLFPPPR